MKKIVIAFLLFTTPAFATGDKPDGDTYVQTWDHSTNTTQNNNQNFFQKLFNQNSQHQGQAQSQSQGQGQGQIATGGNAIAGGGAGGAGGNAINSGVNVRTENTTIVAPNMSGAAGSTGISIGSPFGAFGLNFENPSHYGTNLGLGINALGADRQLLYVHCKSRDAHATLMLKGVRCDLARAKKWNELIAWEAQFQPKKVVKVQKAKPGKKKVRKAKGCGCK